MPQTFADSLNQFPIYADRAEKDELGRNIVCTYATKDEVVGDVLPDMTGNAGKVLAVNQSETAAEWTSIPSPAGKADKVAGAVAGDLAALDCEGNLVDSGIDPSDLAVYPSFTNNAGKVLAVNAGETGVEWVNQSGGGGAEKADKVVGATAGDLAALDCEGNLVDSGIDSSDIAVYPSMSGNAGKVLKVNSSADGVEWTSLSNALPPLVYNAGKYLKVNSQETGTEWVNLPTEIPSIAPINNGNVLKAVYNSTLGTSSVQWDVDNNTEYTGGNMINVDATNHTVAVSTTAGITDIQLVSSLPANPVATVLYLIPVS